jgi:hypothetical protein
MVKNGKTLPEIKTALADTGDGTFVDIAYDEITKK